jgi:hypothetical protein
MLITLPGAGHDIREMLSSAVTTENPISANPKSVCYGEQHVRWRTDDDKPRRFAHANWFGCLISSFLKLDLEYFQQAKILTAIKTAFQEALEKKKMGDNHMEVFVCPRRNDWCYKW